MESKISKTKQRIEEQKLEMRSIVEQPPQAFATPEFSALNSVARKSKHNSIESKPVPQEPVAINALGKNTKRQA